MEVVIVEIVVEIRKTKVLDSVAELETSPPPDFVPGQHPPRELLPFAAVFVPPILNSHVLWKSIQAYNPLGEPTSVQPPPTWFEQKLRPASLSSNFSLCNTDISKPQPCASPDHAHTPNFQPPHVPRHNVTRRRRSGKMIGLLPGAALAHLARHARTCV